MAIDRAKEGRKKAKAKREARLAKSKGNVGRFLKGIKKAAKGIGKDVKSAVKGSKEHQAGKAKKKVAKAKKKEDKSFKRATQRAKKSGESISSLVAKRKGLKKGTAEYNAVQNKINKAYGSRVKHTKVTAESPKKAVSKPKPKAIDKPKIVKTKAKIKPKSKPKSKSTVDVRKMVKYLADTKKTGISRIRKKDTKVPSTSEPFVSVEDKPSPELSEKERLRGKYPPAEFEGGGKVDSSGLFNFPSTDARKRGK